MQPSFGAKILPVCVVFRIFTGIIQPNIFCINQHNKQGFHVMKHVSIRFIFRLFSFLILLIILILLANPQEKEKDNLSAGLAYIHIKSVVWYHSKGKLDAIYGILLNDDLENKSRVESKIENLLRHRTSVYITEFNHLKTPILMAGNYYASVFDFSSFLDAIFNVVFDDKLSEDQKIMDVTNVMERYQNDANDLILKKMKNAEDAKK
jgi:hypothetical protein